ncbi:peptidyl-dipeptidase Dcp [Chitinophaga rupis]|uniref:Dipeptidyl carboxypeptidase n=1 Tax=Chitinophaga rupis TaxID=573321 RepID=A0A1H8F9F9_9BACT|nr:peptidyl-dipeptidase Dcp [Chitinophaga rupis]SEN28185.1 peptidyl-dipeptidase Dcp [Chitinophaga rupis]
MKVTQLPLSILLLGALAACNGGHTSTSGKDSTGANPFFVKSSLPFEAPDFTKIKDADFKPAIEEGIKQQQAEIQAIAEDTAAPTFENTLVALEKSGALLTRVRNVFDLLADANTNDTLDKVREDEAAALAANDDAIYLNTKLFKRVHTLYQERDKLNLDAESKRLVEYYHQQFEMAGANLSDADKEIVKKLNKERASLSVAFNAKVMAGTKAGALVVSDKAALAGLTDDALANAAQAAKDRKLDGKWLLPLQNTTQQPSLQSITDRPTRQALFNASWTRNEKGDSNDTRQLIIRLAGIRAQKAQLLHFKNYAAYNLQDQVAKTPEAVTAFLEKLGPAATAKAKQEAATIQALIDQKAKGIQLAPWDWNYYAEQVRKAQYNLDDNEIKPYFEINSVLTNGVFYAAHLLYGLDFKERHDLPVYQKDVRVFDVIDQDGKQIGLFYCDYFKRDNKSGGAWCNNLVGQSKLLGKQPVIYNVCNFTKPAPGQPALLSFTEARVMFHEFGHALHGFFASQQYPAISGAQTARDFVEFPSQFNEHWAMDPKVFSNYAKHYKTGAAMPQQLVDKIKKAATFNQGYSLTEALAADAIDMAWHTLPADSGAWPKDVDAFEATALHNAGLDLPQVPPRYRSSYFLHIWSGGYASAYYAYAWTEMLAHDAFSWFEENGGLTRANGQRFRDMILSRGNTLDYGKMFRDFRGHDPEIGPLLKSRGLK